MKDGRIYKNTLTDWTPEYLKKPDLSTLLRPPVQK
jgi:hypothetical protein